MDFQSGQSNILDQIKHIKSLERTASSVNIDEENYTQEFVKENFKLGKEQIEAGRFDLAFTLLRKAKDAALKINNRKSLANIIGSIGNVYFYIGDKTAAVEHYLQQLRIFEEEEDLFGQSTSYLGIINSIKDTGDHDKLMYYYDKTVSILESIDIGKDALLFCHSNMITFLTKDFERNKDLIADLCKKTLKLSEGLGAEFKGIAFSGSAKNALLLKNVESALDYNSKAYSSFQEVDYFQGIIACEKRFAEIYHLKGNLKLALDYAKSGLKLAVKHGHVNRELEYLEITSSIYEDLGEDKLALKTFKEFFKKKNEVNELSNSALINEVESRYRIEELERDNELTKENLKKTQKINEDLEQFAHMTSHDLKAPLRSIIGFSNIIQSKHSAKPEIVEFLSRIEENAFRMDNLIDSLLDYSKIGFKEIPLTKTPLEYVLTNSFNSLEQIIEKGKASIRIDAQHSVHGNLTALSQLFQNLIENGLKYNENTQPIIEITSANVEDKIRVFVKDNGIGIPENKLQDVFKAFVRAHGNTKYEGTGIGLASCQKIMEVHKGKISVESELGKGSTFICEFPIHLNN